MDQYSQNLHVHSLSMGQDQFSHGSLPPLMPMMDNSYKRKFEGDPDDGPPKKRQGRRKIKIEFIEDKSRRQITFSKRKAGIMKKAYELTTLTGTQALLLIASETGHVYTFATSKLQPFVTHHEGKALIQRCLNSSEANLPDNGSGGYSQSGPDISQLVDTISIFTYLQVNEDSQTSAPQEPVESNLILLVGKKIPCASFTAANMADLRATVANFSQDGVPITALAGGVPNAFFDHADQSNNHMLINADVVAGIKVAEVDYTSERQPAFSVEDLRHYLQDASSHIPNELWSQIAVKPYINFPPESLVNEGYLLYVVSTYRNAFVNVVFGVRKIGDKGHQVVGISCMPPDNHICCLDVDEASHQARMDMTTEVEGQPLYHLLPELKGV